MSLQESKDALHVCVAELTAGCHLSSPMESPGFRGCSPSLKEVGLLGLLMTQGDFVEFVEENPKNR